MNKDTFWQLIVGVIILAIIFMLARPGSPTAAAIQDVSDALQGLVKTATEYSVTTVGQEQ